MNFHTNECTRFTKHRQSNRDEENKNTMITFSRCFEIHIRSINPKSSPIKIEYFEAAIHCRQLNVSMPQCL